MTTTSMNEEKYATIIESHLLSEPYESSKLAYLLGKVNLEKKLLGITTYRKTTFFPDYKNICVINKIQFDRLSMVFPPSYGFVLVLKISGFFMIQYKTAKVEIPLQIDPFNIQYSGILIPDGEKFDLKNETISLIN